LLTFSAQYGIKTATTQPTMYVWRERVIH